MIKDNGMLHILEFHFGKKNSLLVNLCPLLEPIKKIQILLLMYFYCDLLYIIRQYDNFGLMTQLLSITLSVTSKLEQFLFCLWETIP